MIIKNGLHYFICDQLDFRIAFIFPEKGLVTSLLQAHLVFGIGFFGVFGFLGHFIFSERVARSIGWTSNGFQKELGLITLGIGVSGVYCGLSNNGQNSLPLLIVLSFFLIGAGINHIRELIISHNTNAGNVVIILPDFLIPITLLVLLYLQ